MYRHIHFTGIGGVGMAALAHIMLDAQVEVSGSDIADSANVRALKERGASVVLGHGVLPESVDLLVYSSAVPESDAERQQASARGITQMKRGDFLSFIAQQYKTRIAVSGSHGKTTTSAMIAHIFKICGVDATYLVGGSVFGWDAPGHLGNSGIIVTEVDESDASQAKFPATHAVVLNIDDDHSWALGGTQALEQCFLSLCRNAQCIFTCPSETTTRLFAERKEAQFIAEPVSVAGLYGEHIRRNAAVAIAVCCALGIKYDDALSAMKSFPGVARRLTELARKGDVVLVEDYAHHPTELAATFSALQEKYPDCKIVAVFQPHRMERLERYGARFAEILSQCAWVGVIDTFGAWRQDNLKADIHSLLISKITVPCVFLPKDNLGLVASEAVKASQSNAPCVLAVIGAGDINKCIPEILKGLQ